MAASLNTTTTTHNNKETSNPSEETSPSSPPRLEKPSLSNLPADLFSNNILSHLSVFPDSLTDDWDVEADLGRNLAPYVALAKTSRHLNAIGNSFGYLSFVKKRYPSLFQATNWSHGTTTSTTTQQQDWNAVARAATQLEINYFDRSFVTRVEWVDEATHEPPQDIQWGGNRGSRRGGTRRRPRQPKQQTMGCTPVIDVQDGGFMVDRSEVVAAGVGTDIAIIESQGDRQSFTKVFKEAGTFQPGADDIKGIHLIDCTPEEEEYTVLVARVSGSLRMLRLSGGSDVEVVRQLTYDASGNSPQQIVSSSRHGNVILTTHENGTSRAGRQYAVSLHSLSGSDIPFTTECLRSHPWSSTFLSNDTIAIGCKAGLDAFRIREDGSLSSIFSKTIMVPNRDGNSYPLSVNSVCGISHHYGNGVMASGWYDGCTRLHDLRDPSSRAVLTLQDPLRQGEPVYSLLQTSPASSQLLCGGSSYAVLNIFDIRRPSPTYDGETIMKYKHNCSIYAQGKNVKPRSGVYSLATNAGGGGRRIYVGLEGAVLSMRWAGEDVDGKIFADYVGKSLFYHEEKFRDEYVPIDKTILKRG